MALPTDPLGAGTGVAAAALSTVVEKGVRARSALPIAELTSGSGYGDLPDRDLSQRELLGLAASLAAAPELWRTHVEFTGERRHFVNLRRDDHVDCWVLCWSPDDDTGWHDHDVSSGAVAVVQGGLAEHNLVIGSTSVATEIPAGRAYSFGPDHIHRLTGLDVGSISIHVYSPPLRTLGQYAVDADGVLHRTVVGYAEELRAAEAVLA